MNLDPVTIGISVPTTFVLASNEAQLSIKAEGDAEIADRKDWCSSLDECHENSICYGSRKGFLAKRRKRKMPDVTNTLSSRNRTEELKVVAFYNGGDKRGAILVRPS